MGLFWPLLGLVARPDGRLTRTESLQMCDQVACFLEKPKVFVAGSTGELGRRACASRKALINIYSPVLVQGQLCAHACGAAAKAVLDMIRTGMQEAHAGEFLQRPMS